ncbi:MAG: hypothetical protein CSA34_06610 [Desulfobulbus propionicus]|nr:MAG: hypothetical protein CSA34_06610 [Desulfobulbus propionicus]
MKSSSTDPITSCIGSIILTALTKDEAEQSVAIFLLKRTKRVRREKMAAILANLPFILERNIPEPAAHQVIQTLKKLGAEAVFIPAGPQSTREFATTTQQKLPSMPPVGSVDEDDLVVPDLDRLEKRPSIWFKRQAWQAALQLALALIMVAAALMANYLLDASVLLLPLFTLPTVLAAYLLGPLSTVLTCLCSIILIAGAGPLHLGQVLPGGALLAAAGPPSLIASWALVLIVITLTSALLHKRLLTTAAELYQTRCGLLQILSRLLAQLSRGDHRAKRISRYTAKIAAARGIQTDDIKDLRATALLAEAGAPALASEVLQKTLDSRTTPEPHVWERITIVDILEGRLERILRMLLNHKNSPPVATRESEDPEALGAAILEVAKTYDSLVTNPRGQEALSPLQARDKIVSAGTYDPEAVEAFVLAFNRGDMSVQHD